MLPDEVKSDYLRYFFRYFFVFVEVAENGVSRRGLPVLPAFPIPAFSLPEGAVSGCSGDVTALPGLRRPRR